MKRGKQRRLEKGCTNVKGEPDQGWGKEEDPDCEPDNMPRLAAGEMGREILWTARRRGVGRACEYRRWSNTFTMRLGPARRVPDPK